VSVSVLVFVSGWRQAASGSRDGVSVSRPIFFPLPASRTPLAEHGHEHEHGHGLAHAPLSARVKAGGVLWRHRTGG
jgi:hypothetical protein